MTAPPLRDLPAEEKARFKALWLDQSVSPVEAAKLMGWPRTTARSRALRMGLPNKIIREWGDTRSPESVAVIRRMMEAGDPLHAIGTALGVTRNSIALALKANPDIKRPEKAAKDPSAPPPPKERQAPQAAPGNAPMRYDFRAAPVRFIQQDRDLPPIGERILAELSRRPLTTMTLATVLGVKEAFVGQALSVLRYEGKLAAEDGVNVRQTVWSVAA